jgi:eukaryotic-like serine/threonine-protein kinase
MNEDSLLGQLAEEFTRRVREGKLPGIEEYANRYPELAGRIRELFPTLMLLEGMAGDDDPSVAEATPSPLSAGSIFGNYRVVREIGRGGMGIVYEAVHLLLEKRVALKVLPVQTSSSPLERFLREAKTAAGLHHTNIVPVFDVGQVAGIPYFAMQYIEGCSLDQALRLANPAGDSDVTKNSEINPKSSADDSIRAGLPAKSAEYFRWVAGIGIQAAAGLDYAHERKIIHRDIKPSNLILDKEGVLWIADFGLARKIEDANLTNSGMLIGTPRYMSPEQAEIARRPVDQRTDIYSLGVTLYELLTRKPVFEGKTPQEVLSQIISREPVAPRRLNPEIPADLETVVLKAMAKQQGDRYQSAQEFGEDLDRWRKMEAIKARPIGPFGRFIRWCRRNPRLMIVTVAAAAIILILSGVYYRSLLIENANTRLALEREKKTRNQISDALNQSEASKQQAEAAQAEADLARKKAETDRTTAQVGRTSAIAISQLGKDPELALLLALEAANSAHTEESERALRQSLLESNIRAVFSASEADFSPDGKTILAIQNNYQPQSEVMG